MSVSGYPDLPPAFWSSKFTTQMFDSGKYLTKAEADRLYLSIGASSLLSLLDGVTPGTAQANKVLALGASKQVSGLGVLGIADVNDGIVISNSSSSGRSDIKFTNDTGLSLEFGLRGSTATFGSYAYWHMNGGYRMLMNSSGDLSVLSTTAATNYMTGCMVLSGGCGVQGKLYVNDTISTNTAFLATTGFVPSQFNNAYVNSSLTMKSGAPIYLENGAANTAAISIINTGTNKALTLQSPANPSTYSVLNLSTNGIAFQKSTGSPAMEAQCPLDFGVGNAADVMINLYNGGYAIGAARNALQLLSEGTSGIYMGRGSSYSATRFDANLTQNGSFQVAQKLRCCGTSSADFSGFSGPGLEFGYSSGSGYGEIYAYNRNTLLYKGVYIGNEIYCDGNGHTTVGAGAASSVWKLEVGSNTQSVSSYGYLNSGGGTGFSGGSGSVAFSAYFQGRIAVQGEVDVLSDLRLKSGIRSITDSEAESFFNLDPKHYTFCPETNNDRQYGYIAQDVAKAGLHDLVCCRLEEGLPEHVDSDGFVSPKDSCMSLSYPKMTALLHKYVKLLEARVKSLEALVYRDANDQSSPGDQDGDPKTDSSDNPPPKKRVYKRRGKAVAEGE